MKTAVALTVLALFAAAPAQAGVTLSFACDSTGKGYDICKAGADAWAAKTGNTVNVLQVPNEAGDREGGRIVGHRQAAERAQRLAEIVA